MKSTRRWTIAAGAVIAIGSIAFASVKMNIFKSSEASTSSAALAIVNGKAITTSDVKGLMAAGMVRPVAVENAINRQLTAEAARHLWPAESQAVADSIVREALSTFYLRKKAGELQQAVSDEDVNRFYEANVKDELYSGHILKYYLTQDAKDAAEMDSAIKQGNSASLAKFTWVNKDGDHAVLPAGVPYGLYSQVKTLQSGQYLGPWRVRDGVLFLKLEERKQAKRPELTKVKDEIRQIVTQQRLESALKELREQARIELK